MATERLRYLIEAVWSGKGATISAANDIKSVGTSGKTATMDLKSLAVTGAAVGAAIAGAAITARKAWEAIGEGAGLERARDQFNRLATSIGADADHMLEALTNATGGIVSQAELIAGAGQIMSLGLADTEEGVVRLSTLISELGWDMQTVILTFANNSKMRLDSLGLSVEDVDSRMKKLMETGMSMDAAFDMAVIEAGEEKLDLLGSAADTTAGKMKILEASWKDLTDTGKKLLVEAVEPLISFLASSDERSMGALFGEQDEIAATSRSLDEFVQKLREAGLFFGMEAAREAWRQYNQGVTAATAGLELFNQTQIEVQRANARLIPAGHELEDSFEDGAGAGREFAEALLSMEAAAIMAERGLVRVDQAAINMQAAREGRADMFGGLRVDGLDDARQAMLGAAADFGATAQALFTVAGGSEAAGEMLKQLAIEARAVELGKLVAEGLDPSVAVAALEEFRASLDLEALFAESRRVGSGEIAQTMKERMLAEVEGITGGLAETAATAMTPATEAVDTFQQSLTDVVDNGPYEPEIDSNALDVLDNQVTPLKSYLDNLVAQPYIITVGFNVGEFPEIPGGGLPGLQNATGGGISGGVPTIVGEQGPEIFVPQTAGMIIPNHQLGGGANRAAASTQLINFNVVAPNPLATANAINYRITQSVRGMR